VHVVPRAAQGSECLTHALMPHVLTLHLFSARLLRPRTRQYYAELLLYFSYLNAPLCTFHDSVCAAFRPPDPFGSLSFVD
jgi:hypothetical protein